MAKLLRCCPENSFMSAAQPRLVNPEVTLSPLKFIRYVSLRLLFYIFRIQSQYLPVGFLAGTIWTSLVGAAMFPSPKHEQREGETNRAQIGEWREVEHRCNRCYSMGQGHVDRTTDWQQFTMIHLYRLKCPLSAVAIIKLYYDQKQVIQHYLYTV